MTGSPPAEPSVPLSEPLPLDPPSEPDKVSEVQISGELAALSIQKPPADHEERAEAKPRPETPPWYKGLTTEERAEARRKYKNRKASKRWRDKKEAEAFAAFQSQNNTPTTRGSSQSSQSWTPPAFPASLAAAHAASGNLELALIHSANEVERLQNVIRDLKLHMGEREAEGMLYEFKKLGKVEEARLLLVLRELSSFSMLPNGFQTNKEAIVRLCNLAVDLTRGGPTTAQDVALRCQGWNVKVHPDWSRFKAPIFTEILAAFANRTDHQAFIDLLPTTTNTPRRISLQMAASLSWNVVAQYYIQSTKIMQEQIPIVLHEQHIATAQEGKRIIEEACSSSIAICISWILGNSGLFSANRVVKAPTPSTAQDLITSKVFAKLDMRTHARLWEIWDEYCLAVQPLLLQKASAERNLDTILSHHDAMENQSFVLLMEAVKQLLMNYTKLLECSFLMDIRCAVETMTPLQTGILCGLQLPNCPQQELFQLNIDPFIRWSLFFTSGVINRDRASGRLDLD